MTNLNDNESVQQAFVSHVASIAHCKRLQPDLPAALVTGFGLFSGSAYNLSGIVSMSMADEGFWPSTVVNLDEAVTQGVPFAHSQQSASNGVMIRQRILDIEGKKMEVCFLYLDVKWDLAAAIIAHEATRFGAKAVIMSGVNGKQETTAFLERGAINRAKLLHGFDSLGFSSTANIPVSENEKVVPHLALGAEVSLTWSAQSLKNAVRPLIKQIDESYDVSVPAIREDNSYICNNVSIAVRENQAGRDVALAGGALTLPARPGANVKVGFLHYPYAASEAGTADDPQRILGWCKVIAKILTESL